MARLDDKHFVVGKHLSESVGKDFAHVDVDLMHLELLLVTLGPAVSTATGIISHLQMIHTNTQKQEHKTKRKQRPLVAHIFCFYSLSFAWLCQLPSFCPDFVLTVIIYGSTYIYFHSSHLFQADTCPLDQCLESGDSFILSQQVGIEG